MWHWAATNKSIQPHPDFSYKAYYISSIHPSPAIHCNSLLTSDILANTDGVIVKRFVLWAVIMMFTLTRCLVIDGWHRAATGRVDESTPKKTSLPRIYFFYLYCERTSERASELMLLLLGGDVVSSAVRLMTNKEREKTLEFMLCEFIWWMLTIESYRSYSCAGF